MKVKTDLRRRRKRRKEKRLFFLSRMSENSTVNYCVFFFFFFFSSLPSYIFSSYNSQSMSISTSVHVHRMIVLKVERELERSHLFSSPLVVFFYLRMKCLSDHFSIIVEIDLTLTVRHSNNEEILSLLR